MTRKLTGGEVVSAYRQICENARRTFRENEKLARKLGLQKTPFPYKFSSESAEEYYYQLVRDGYTEQRALREVHNVFGEKPIG